uniref:putative bifunctional UDP-N-acetylglucosamine transferase and deubiquitinase ALG13 isoform X2 n=1 Tax=Doryrhamphus excisus TaxID=161450 RepID=UPI0025ADE6AD|nr:putative bifunctional UDP-N-acetylglucosamine transferase and deubiquitinase ALG13 isoform X2 [Doryrhamphus excisus]
MQLKCFGAGGMHKDLKKYLKKYFVNMDDYLDSLGLYRKIVARDASSLFLAVSEQIVEGSFVKYLERLEDPKETGGQVEIKAISQRYRCRFLVYRYPGKPPSAISEGEIVDKLMLCCSINGHYDIIYTRTYRASAALCQAVLYERLYTKVFGCQAMEVSMVSGRTLLPAPPMCGDIDIGSREEAESGAAAEETQRAESGKPPCISSLPCKVIKSLDGDVYRKFWQELCKEMQKKKTIYLVFAGKRYFLGDKCQVRLEPDGMYFNAFIQEVGKHSNAVTVFIEELGERHLVPLTDLNPVPAWNVATASRKGRLDSDVCGRRHRRRSHPYFRRPCGSSGIKGAVLLVPPPAYGGPAPLCFQPAGNPRPPPPPPSSSRFLNLGPQLVYYGPTGRHYYYDESYAFRSRRRWRHWHWLQQMAAALHKECQFAFPDTAEESADLDGAITYSQLDDANEAAFPPQTAPSVAPPPPVGSAAGHAIACSSEEEQVDASTVEDQDFYSTQDPASQTAIVSAPAEPAIRQDQQEEGVANSPPRADMSHSYTQQAVKPLGVISSPSSSPPSSPSSPSSCAPAASHLPVAASPWLVNELGETLCTVVTPPPYSYDSNGNDLPRDYRVLQYYFNLGLQWYHRSCWQQQQAYTPSSPDTPYLSQEAPLHAAPHSYPEVGRRPYQLSPSYPDSNRAVYRQPGTHGGGPTPSMEGYSVNGLPSRPVSSSALLYQDQTALLHLPYEAPPPATYLSSAPPRLPHTAHNTHLPTTRLRPSTHWRGAADRRPWPPGLLPRQ